jgi:hypothetical protein
MAIGERFELWHHERIEELRLLGSDKYKIWFMPKHEILAVLRAQISEMHHKDKPCVTHPKPCATQIQSGPSICSPIPKIHDASE